ncbi:hypothetical protein BDGGKGIB_03553 [Nodularia sphaerocarpa UHCC 0038]|nr:hypothetical protein BDGGKGIB_03553 [Nodularia sphaerocarpa UHCC 0038]
MTEEKQACLQETNSALLNNLKTIEKTLIKELSYVKSKFIHYVPV